MYAVIETGGKQYRVKAGDVITVEKLNLEVGDKITFDKVLMSGDGKDLKVGTPYVDTKVEGEVVENGKAKKVIIFKYKAKKDYRKKQGHRQPYTMIEIKSVGGEVAPVKEEAVVAEDKKVASINMKKDELLAIAKEMNVEVSEKDTKQVILDKINAAN